MGSSTSTSARWRAASSSPSRSRWTRRNMPRDRAQPTTPDSPKELTPWRDRLKWVRRDAGHIVSLASLDDNPADGIRWAIGYLDARLNILDQKFDSILQF